jgi:hypothetical protein
VRGFGLDRRTPNLERFWMVSMQSSFLVYSSQVFLIF